VSNGIKTIIYPVTDLAQAKDRFAQLSGVQPYVDEPYYVGFRIEGQEVGLDPNGHRIGSNGPVSYWHVEDVAATLQELVDAGAQTKQEVKDVGGGRLTAIATDPDGNVIGLVQAD
jgi:predicted enzyme related to lactoylglutathione lyase